MRWVLAVLAPAVLAGLDQPLGGRRRDPLGHVVLLRADLKESDLRRRMTW